MGAADRLSRLGWSIDHVSPQELGFPYVGPHPGPYNLTMGRIGLPELVVIFVIVLLIFGPRKLPDLARGIGQAIRGFKEAVAGGEKKDGDHWRRSARRRSPS